jgi:hypothetical protein
MIVLFMYVSSILVNYYVMLPCCLVDLGFATGFHLQSGPKQKVPPHHPDSALGMGQSFHRLIKHHTLKQDNIDPLNVHLFYCVPLCVFIWESIHAGSRNVAVKNQYAAS